ncbi:MAG: hypothetical protein DRP63_02665 [Planctomycetota bacterium]|nr:MAG: hypothetical protein DRP63_02665 [Planctomycetota bacterium]
MRLMAVVVAVAVVMVAGILIAGLTGAQVASAVAQNVYKPGNNDEKVDLPVPKPTRSTGWQDTEKDKEEKPDNNQEEDDEDDSETPPIEFFDEEVEGDRVVFVMDYTGSMDARVGHPITDENGHTISNPTKMDHVKAEFAKAVLGMSENVKFSAVMFSTSGIRVWKRQLMDATPQNKSAAIAWVRSFSAWGATPIYDGFAAGANIPGTKTIILHTDGVVNSGKYPNPSSCGSAIISLAKSKGITVYTFGHCLATFYGGSQSNSGREMLKKIAQGTGGTYTEVN